jgi:hypothetical protein
MWIQISAKAAPENPSEVSSDVSDTVGFETQMH